MVLVPDSVIKRNCKADVYSLGFLILHLLLSIDFFHASDSQLQRLKPEVIDLSPQLLDLLSHMFSGDFSINDVLQHPYFVFDDESKFGAGPISEVIPVEVLYDKNRSNQLITQDTINLANFEGILQKYNEQINILQSRDKEGRSGVRLLDKQLMSLIDENQSTFKTIQLPKPEQVSQSPEEKKEGKVEDFMTIGASSDYG